MLDFLTLNQKQALQQIVMRNQVEISLSEAEQRMNELSYLFEMMFLGRTDKVYDQTWDLLAALFNGIVVAYGKSKNPMPVYADPRSREMHADAQMRNQFFPLISRMVAQSFATTYPVKGVHHPKYGILRGLFKSRAK